MDDQYKVVRINNFLLSLGINNSNTFKAEEGEVDREPTALEYDKLLKAADIYFGNVFQNAIDNDCATFVKVESKYSSKSYKQENIPNDKYQICVRYSYLEVYFTKDSVLTDEMNTCPEGILNNSFGTNAFLHDMRAIGNGETPFRAAENVYFGYLGNK